jgi:hypothetical protein
LQKKTFFSPKAVSYFLHFYEKIILEKYGCTQNDQNSEVKAVFLASYDMLILKALSLYKNIWPIKRKKRNSNGFNNRF